MFSSIFRWGHDHRALLYVLGAASVAVFVASLVLIPMAVVRIPPDYFGHSIRPVGRRSDRSRLFRAAHRCGKNALGLVFIVAGVAMLALPGQGLLTILLGVLLLDFPGKYRFEKWLVSRPGLLQAINWLRRRAGRPPLQAAQ